MIDDGKISMNELLHYGTPMHSGRYPYGSGANPNQRHETFLERVDKLKKQGLTEKQIADGLGINTKELRAKKAIAKNAERRALEAEAEKLREKGMSPTAIGRQMGMNESSVRALLDPAMRERAAILSNTADMLKDEMEKGTFIDIGVGTEQFVGVSKDKLSTAVAMLEEEGYKTMYIKEKQPGTNHETTLKVLVPPGTEYADLVNNKDRIKVPNAHTEDGGRTYLGLVEPVKVDPKRVDVKWGEDGGEAKDGVIELRRGVDDISLGGKNYAQVRIAVGDGKFLKGMAMYSDDLPDGVDILFNTNKTRDEVGGDKMKTMKQMKDDPDNPFGSVVRQRFFTDKDGNQKLSAINIIGEKEGMNEEGGWNQWSKSLSSQFLSKQSPKLAQEQLGISYDLKKSELDEIMSLTNPVVKKKLLASYADGADASAVKLSAAGIPRTRSQVLLPLPDMKDNEIFAPNYRNGEKVVLVRHPHGGIFELPELTVNNRNPKAKKILGGAEDAVGINPKVAKQLSGADFDGDTVLVIPNNLGKIKTSSPLGQLKDFDAKATYPLPKGAKPMSAKSKQKQMGDISNLITDMTIKGAPVSDIARAVKHSMVVIDAEKHKLDYKQSAKDNGIKDLKTKYQGKSNAGASTLISKASSEQRVAARKPRSAANGGPIDKATGKKMWEDDPKGSFVDKNGKTVTKTVKSTKMAETNDAFSLVSKPGTKMESIYATHANKVKSLANTARKEIVSTPNMKISPSAKKIYAHEVSTLRSKLNVAQKNAPLERQAILLANSTVSAKRKADPNLTPEEIKKIKGQALTEARRRTGADKVRISITPKEWEAVQSGAVSSNLLDSILNHADLDQVKQYAMPRNQPAMSVAKVARAKSMLNAGYTAAEVADTLGVSTSTLYNFTS